LAQVIEIPITKLYVGKFNVRSDAGDITELTRSIEQEGVLQPILVRRVKDRFEIVVGSRRFSAAKAAGLKSIPSVIREMDDGEAIVASLSENIQRGDLQPEEEAKAIEKLVGIYRSNREVARVLGISESTIRMKLSVLELVPKLRSKMRIKYAPSPKEREKEGALPFEHATMIAEAFRTEEIKRLPKEEREEKEYLHIMIAIQPFKIINEKRQISGIKLRLRKEFPFEELLNEELFKVQWKDLGEKIYHALTETYWQFRLLKRGIKSE